METLVVVGGIILIMIIIACAIAWADDDVDQQIQTAIQEQETVSPSLVATILADKGVIKPRMPGDGVLSQEDSDRLLAMYQQHIAELQDPHMVKLAKHKQYYQEHKDKWKIYNARRKAKLAALPEPPTEQPSQQMFSTENGFGK